MRKPGLEPWLHHFLAVCLWASGKVSLSLGHLSSKMGLKSLLLRGMPTYRGDKNDDANEAPSAEQQSGGVPFLLLRVALCIWGCRLGT